MQIAVLGWGSLVWQPTNSHGELSIAQGESWHTDGPRLPVEFARISADGRLTLIISPNCPIASPVLWTTSGRNDFEGAIANLAQRETNAPIECIHAATRQGACAGDPDPTVAGTVAAWVAGRPGIDAAIWTGLGEGTSWEGRHGFSRDAAVEYLESLTGPVRERALEYLCNAPLQIDTPVRRSAAYLLDASR